MGRADAFLVGQVRNCPGHFERAIVSPGDLKGAIAECERITTFDPKYTGRRLINPLDHYRMAKPYEQKRQKDKAAVGYRLFDELCKDAEPGQPEVDGAKACQAAPGK